MNLFVFFLFLILATPTLTLHPSGAGNKAASYGLELYLLIPLYNSLPPLG